MEQPALLQALLDEVDVAAPWDSLVPTLCLTGPARIAGAGAAVVLHRPGTPAPLVRATDERLAELHQAGLLWGEGPAMEAVRQVPERAVPVVARRVAAVRRWPRWSALALQAGVHACVALPIVVGDRVVGATTLHRASAGPLPAAEVEAAGLLLALAGVVLAVGQRTERDRSASGQLRRALETRGPTERAKGVLCARHGVEPDHAFEMLRRHARTRSVRLVEVVADVLAGRRYLEPPRSRQPHQNG